MTVLGASNLDEALARRLVPLARTSVDFRFLAHRVPSMLVRDLLARVPEGERPTVEQIARHRTW